jgi:hydroxyacylglutathione hydrolase
VRLTPHVHLVGSGAGGFHLTDAYDCHVYLVDGGTEAALVDAGIGSATDEVLANVAAAGVALEVLRVLVLTHAHPDHAGGAARLRARLPALDVAASPAVAGWVRTGDEGAMSVEAGKRADFYPPDYRFAACDVERELGEGDRLAVGSVELEVVETPGHSDGHLSLLLSADDGVTLFGGDLVFFGGQVSLEANWDCRIPAYAASMGKLREANVDALLPGHHFVTLRDGQRHIDAANRLFERGFVPKSVV